MTFVRRTPKDKHDHVWEDAEQVVPVRNRSGIISGKDRLKQRKCGCGVVYTYDLDRFMKVGGPNILSNKESEERL